MLLDRWYNSGQFTATMTVLEMGFDSPFSMFSAMAEFYEARDYFVHVPARSYRYEVMFSFVKEYLPQLAEVARQTLTFDLYLREHCKSRAEFALDLTPWKEQLRQNLGQKQNHIDVFTYPVWEKQGEKIIQPLAEPWFVEFCYSKRDPLTHNASINCKKTGEIVV